MKPLAAAVAAALAAAALPSQQIAVQAVPASTSLVTTAQVGGGSQTQTSTAFPDLLGVAAGAPGNEAVTLMHGYVGVTDSLVDIQIHHELGVVVAPGIQGMASCDTDVRFQLTAPTPTLVRLQVVVTITGTPGMPFPAAGIDVGADGSLEYQLTPTPTTLVPVPIGPSATPVRVFLSSRLIATGSAIANLQVLIEPNFPVDLHRSALACDGLGPYFDTLPTFDGGIVVGATPVPGLGPMVLVLGLDVQPFVLPATAALPCLLLPRADILVPMPGTNQFALPLPAALRPVTFWLQGVRVAPAGLLTTDAFRVDAP